MKPIPLYPGYYLTSDYQIIGKQGRPMSFSSTQDGRYKFVCVMQGTSERWSTGVLGLAKRSILYLHRAIALVHVKGYFEGAHVDHIDGDTHNNNPKNLRWVTRHQNQNNRREQKMWASKFNMTIEAWNELSKKEQGKRIRLLIKGDKKND